MVVRLLRHRRRLPAPQRDPTPSTRPIEPVPVKRLLLAMSSKTAWRATVGDCDTPGKIERSTNGGASWKRIVRTGPAPIVRLGAEPSGDVFAIGGTRRSCSVRYVAYANDGTVTASATARSMCGSQLQRTAMKSMGPAGQKTLHVTVMPSALRRSTYLKLWSFAITAPRSSSRNSGKTWRQVARIPDALAITAGSGRYWVAGAHEGCDGVTVQSLTEKSGSLTRGRTRCAAGLDVAAGQVAFDVTGDGTIWLWSGSRVVVSRDDGQTWK